jgi:hypothetical protein
MFSRGATPGRVETWTYDEEDEDFTKGSHHWSSIEQGRFNPYPLQTPRIWIYGSLSGFANCFTTRRRILHWTLD